MAVHTTLASLFSAIADAIRAKTGSSAQIVADNFPEEIAAISTGIDTSDATAAASDILSGKTAYGPNGKMTGTIPSRGSGDLSASGATVTVPAGYYPSQVIRAVTTATQATPSISVSSSGLITASATQDEGYVSSGSKSATHQLTTQAGRTITPGTSQQTAVASGRYTTGNVIVAGDSDLVASNIRSGVNIFGVTGTLEPYILTTASLTIENDTPNQYYIGYVDNTGEAGDVRVVSAYSSRDFTVMCGSVVCGWARYDGSTLGDVSPDNPMDLVDFHDFGFCVYVPMSYDGGGQIYIGM